MLRRLLQISNNEKVSVYIDKNRIKQVLTNLVTNAIKYAPDSKKVVIKAKKRVDGYVVISVQDFGIGIPLEQQLKIFDRFFQANTSQRRTYPGLGLGLYIAKEIIESHGGQIWVESQPAGGEEKGSIFFFTLPILKRSRSWRQLGKW